MDHKPQTSKSRYVYPHKLTGKSSKVRHKKNENNRLAKGNKQAVLSFSNDIPSDYKFKLHNKYDGKKSN